jgi:hypothetical protein
MRYSRCSKVDAIIGKGVPGGGFDIDRVMKITITLGRYLYSEPLTPN